MTCSCLLLPSREVAAQSRALSVFPHDGLDAFAAVRSDPGLTGLKEAAIPIDVTCHHGRADVESAERERESLHARAEKLDLEGSIDDGVRLADQLIHPLFGHGAVALLVNVGAVSRPRRLTVDQYAKSHRSAWCCGPHD